MYYYIPPSQKHDKFFGTEGVYSNRLCSYVFSDLVHPSMQFPLLSKCARFQKLIPTTGDENIEIPIHDIPGGPKAFEICAKFCYGMVVTLNAYNVVAARCAAEYLEMNETVDKGNLIYK